MTKKNLSNILLILLIFSLSFTNQNMFSIGFNNLIPLRIIILMFIFWMFVISKSKSINDSSLKRDKIFFVLILLSVIRLLSIFVAIDRADALVLNVFWLSIIGLYLSLKWFIKKKKSLDKYLFYYFLSTMVAAVFGIIQALYFVFWGISYWNIWSWQYPAGFRISGLMLDSNHYAVFILSGMFVGLPFVYKLKGKKRLWGISMLFTLFISFLLASSRSALLGLLASFAVLVFISLTQRKFKYVVFSFGIFLTGIVFGTLINKGLDIYTNNYVEQNFIIHEEVKREDGVKEDLYVEDITSSNALGDLAVKLLPGRVRRVFDASAKSHLALLNASLKLGIENPILGVGYGNFAEGLKASPYIKLLELYDPRGASQEDFPSHTKWGGVLAETGFLGFFAYLGLIILIIMRLLRDKSVLGISILAGFVGFQIFSIFYHLNEEFYWVFTFLGLMSVKYKKS